MNVAAEPTRRLIYNEHLLAPRLFAVVTWGCSASNWLAYALNECPQIFAVHHSNYVWTKFGGAQSLPGPRYIEIVGMQGHAALAAGDVHGIARTDIPAIQAAYGDIFKAAVLVRDPLPRLRSLMSFFKDYAHTGAWEIDYVDALFPQIVKALPTGSYEEKLFVHGVTLLNAIVEETFVGPIYLTENLTTKPDALVGLVDYLTAGTVTPTEEWAQAMTASRRTNSHVKSDTLDLERWQRRVLVDLLRPAALEIYSKLGYDVEPLIAVQ